MNGSSDVDFRVIVNPSDDELQSRQTSKCQAPRASFLALGAWLFFFVSSGVRHCHTGWVTSHESAKYLLSEVTSGR